MTDLIPEETVNFIQAETAYGIAMESYETKVAKKINELKILIEEAAERGELKLIYDHKMLPEVAYTLTSYNYQITEKTLNDPEKKVYIISWDFSSQSIGTSEFPSLMPPVS